MNVQPACSHSHMSGQPACSNSRRPSLPKLPLGVLLMLQVTAAEQGGAVKEDEEEGWEALLCYRSVDVQR